MYTNYQEIGSYDVIGKLQEHAIKNAVVQASHTSVVATGLFPASQIKIGDAGKVIDAFYRRRAAALSGAK